MAGILQIPPIVSDFPQKGIGLEDSKWFPDSSGIKTFTEDRVDHAIAHRDKVLDDLKNVLANLGTQIGELGAIPQVTATLEAINPAYVPAPMAHYDAPVAPTDIGFVKPPLPVITEIVANFPKQTEYVSKLLTDVESVLDGLILNLRQTGLNPVIEQQIWDRGRERTLAAAQGAIDNINRQFARAGWQLPQGDQVEAIYAAQEQQAEADITESRNIAVAQADLEQKNLQFAIQQGVALCTALANIHMQLQAQYIEAEKARVETLAELNKLNVEVFKELVDADVAYVQGKLGIYKTEAEVFSTEVNAEASRVKSGVELMSADLAYKAKKVEVDVEIIKANISTLLAKNELLIKTMTSEAQLQAQIAASIGGAVNFGAHISGSSSYGNAVPTIVTV
ncbi:MAG: hypothetical protein ACXWDN_07080 [Limisphaerales bacterium]